MNDLELLHRYALQHDERAFLELVRRHLDWVYSSARRQVQDAHLAEDVTQAVFLALSQQASKLQKGVVLPAWLLQVTRRASAMALRSKVRRRRMEEKAASMRSEESSTTDAWQQIAPVLDELVASLPETNRLPILLRFYQGKSWPEVGQALGITEEAARMRAGRALEKLKVKLEGKELMLGSATTLATALSANVTQAAPAGLTSVIVSTAAAPAIASATVISLSKGAATMVAWAKAKTAAAITMLTLLAGGGGTLVLTQLLAQEAAQSPPPATAAVPESASSSRVPAINDAQAIQGTWLVVSAADAGQPAPAEEMAGVEVVITDKDLSIIMDGKLKPRERLPYQLDPLHQPKWIDLTNLDAPDQVVPGIYELQGDSLKICFSENDNRRPTQFASEPGDSPNEVLMVLKREEAIDDLQAEYPKLAPFTAVRWTAADVPEVRLDKGDDAAWYELLELDGIASAAIVQFCKQTYPSIWQKRFEEDLVEVLSVMGNPPGPSVKLKLRLPDTNAISDVPDVPMTEDNGKLLWRSLKDRPSTP